jgi:tetratricopeptide (TPR) repeat protein
MRLQSFLMLLAVLLGSYLAILTPFTHYMNRKPYEEKLGVIPRAEVLQIVSGDQKQFLAASIITKVIMYYGSLFEKDSTKFSVPPDYPAISRAIHAALKIDPYNMDGYYFAQAVLAWDVGKVDIANSLLDYGMRYRTWDWYLPFFAGFNHAYFLKDYAAAAEYYRRAGELSGSDLFKRLAGRYMQESGRTDLAIAYLFAMEKGEKNPAIRKTYQIRLSAFRDVRRIEVARDKYLEATGTFPVSVELLVQNDFLSPPPVDPYGGRYYFEPDGKVTTTSKFAFAPRKSSGESNEGRGKN